MSFSAEIAATRRFFLLGILTQAPPLFKANNRAIHRGLIADCPYPPSLDQVNGDIQWLSEQGLVAIERFDAPDGGGSSKTIVARLTARGDDVAHGRAIVPGVEAPAPLVD